MDGSRADGAVVEEVDLLRQLRRLGYERDDVLAALQEIQHRYGYLPEPAFEFVAEEFDTSLADVTGLATFFDQIALGPRGRPHARFCIGTACQVYGSMPIHEALEDELDVRPGRATEHGAFTLAEVRCVGACSLAAVVQFDDDTHAEMNPDDTVGLLGAYR